MNVAEYIHDMAVKARAAAGELAKLSIHRKFLPGATFPRGGI